MAGSRSARAGSKRTAGRRRAVGTRDRIIAHLAVTDEIADPTGMASTRLAEAVGYPGSSVAFAQLLSGMERDGLIAREVRGKRTYRITLADGAAARSGLATSLAAGSAAGPGGAIRPGAPAASGSGGRTGLDGDGRRLPSAPAMAAAEFDYDELARRLLVQVIRRLATPPEGQEEVVADLERELAVARTRASSLTAENRKLREQLSLARFSLDQARQGLDLSDLDLEQRALNQGGPIGEELSDAEVVLLEGLLTPELRSEGQESGATAS